MDGTKKLSTAIGFGIITLLILASITSMLIALLLKFTDISEGTLAITIFILAFLSMLISGFIAGKKAQGKGWFVGFTTGLIFAILVFLVNYLGFSLALSNSQLLYQLGLMGASTLGGIFGVNMSKRTD
ncbi:TIGR04086 family membrane protein [Bacillus pseudomycoides]|uniref:TIGR04086 family membrane protein n=1 Tax=Bacillus pseudomycoides TaxID=64104 RepID=A0A2B6RMW5_9BACI|nr:TIGR04086 family membrane protein [Bacillus pseudomycoides]PDY49256.1 TIGR04086 family membrane protein [Bacillus pseudomycoides]PEA85033.1 TIGR04086 family membrane protein [Bacillus pseudomycoides]PED69811.1 TIGR04086 family membrane protein [Bacillus pseudomycoides]PEI45279.1 TIGR04086 family membrane protein [Bacillus pseudomycoides]PEJ79244.1 TIGR04086 family membrane protein [Bacillus pseudomycoides]